jgi:hypothetical protein
MSSFLAHGGMFAASHTMLVFLPFLIAGAGLAFIVRALSDKVDAKPPDGSARLPSAKEHPLYHLHMQIRSAGRPESPEPTPGAPSVVKMPPRRRH